MKTRKLFFGVLLHAAISAVLASGFIATFTNELAMNLTMSHANRSDFVGELLLPTLLIWVIAGTLWSILYLTYSQLSSRQLTAVRLVRTTGSVMAETLIVLPVYFLLVFGLMQMAIISMAGLLTTVGTYNAARTAAVWAPEIGHNRTGAGAVTPAQVNEKIRTAVAAVVAPVTPGSSVPVCRSPRTINAMLAGMLDHGVNPQSEGDRSLVSLTDALEARPFADRAAGKLINAYCSVDVSGYEGIDTDMDSVELQPFVLRVRYAQPMTMPLVGPIFRTGGFSGAWATSDVASIERTFSFTAQMPPNPLQPQSAGFFSGLTSPSKPAGL